MDLRRNASRHVVIFTMNFRTHTVPAAICLGMLCYTLSASDGSPEIEKRNTNDLKAKYRRPVTIPFPADNSFTKDREELGRTLFFDPRLSGSGAISCASCHNPAFGWDDGLAKGIGHGSKQLARRTPSIVNVAWGELFFWDGRAESLEDQALGPIKSENEMNLSLEKMLKTVRSIQGYAPLFERAYPGSLIDEQTIAKAIATFERTLVSTESPFDRWVKGDEAAISESAKRGFVAFNGKARCAECHSGWEFTDHGFHDIGTSDDDLGRGKFLKLDSMQHAFKTPGLRNSARRAAFMHDGSETSLKSVIDFYDNGGMCLRPSLSPEIQPLHLAETEKSELLQFLRSLTSAEPKVSIPSLPGRDFDR